MKHFLKSLVSIVLLLVLFIQVWSRVFIFADYVINKEYIARVFCINKDKPEMRCNGKCHLKKQLEKEEGKFPLSQVKACNELILFSEKAEPINFVLAFELTEAVSTNLCHISDKHSLSVFHPPQG